MCRVIVPPKIEEICADIIFLAGPIQGALDWQADAIWFIHNLNPNIVIANPRRPDFDFERDFEPQIDWESYYLQKSAGHGAIMFWLAAEVEHDCRRAFAQTSRFELGEWFARCGLMKTKIALGIEKGFFGEDYIRYRLRKDRPHIPVFNSLEKTCQKTLQLIKNR